MNPPNIQPLMHRALRNGSRLTSSARMSPSFLIVGGQRCGTTSLWRALAQHPGVIGPARRKGIHYFDVSYHKGMRWYRGHFPLLVSAHHRARKTGAMPITGESSPYYLFHPLVAARIARDLPGVKVLILVRDPVERAYSAYTHERSRGFESESFERALELEPQRLHGEADRLSREAGYYSQVHRHNAYLQRGEYLDQILPYEVLFGRDRMCVVDSDDFFSQPQDVFATVSDFLGLGPATAITFGQNNARPRSPMPEPLRARLTEHFQPHDERLAQWWGHTPSWRR